MIGSLLVSLAHAQAVPALPTAPGIPVGVPAPVVPPATAGPVDFTPPVSLAPLVVAWPADMPAPADATAVPVDLELLINERGYVEAVTIRAGEEPFASLAAVAVKAQRFAPATENGQTLAVYVPVHLDIVPPPVNVEGVIALAGGGGPAAGLVVTVAGQSVTTDSEGRFAFRAIPPGEQTLRVMSESLRVDDQALTVTASDAVRLQLFARVPRVEAGVVGFYRRDRDEVLRRTITAQELRTLPGTMGDPLRAVANLPGAARTPLDAGWLLIRGGDPRDTGVYIDGTRVPLIYHLGGFTSVIHPGYIQQVDFYPGGQSARYGRATAGAVDLRTHPRAETLEIRAGANIVLAGAYAAVPLGKTSSVSAAIRRSYLDGVLNLVPGITAEQANIAPRFWDWQVRADVGTPVGPVTAFGMGYFDTIDASTVDGNGASITTQSHRIHGSWRGEVGGKPLIVKPYYGYEMNEIAIDVLDRVQRQQRNGGGARIELADAGQGWVGWSAGVDTSFEYFTMDYNNFVRHGHLDSPDAYADVRIGKEIRGVIGLRMDTLLVTGQLPRFGPSPRASLEIPVSDMLTLVADGGLYHQPPPADLLVGPPEGATLRLEQSFGGGGGVRITYGPWQVGIDGYNRRITRITGFEEDGSLGQSQGEAAGFETMVRYGGERVSGWLTYTYARSLRREDVTDTYRASRYDQPHYLVAVGALDLGQHWTLGSRFRFASGFPVPSGEVISAYDVLKLSTELLVPDEFGRTEPFHSLDIKLSKQAIYKKWRLEYYLDVQNVYNRRVAEPVISGVWEAYGTQTYGFGLPVLPILGIEGVFGGP